MTVECWCGNSDLALFGEGYLHCRKCETLVAVTDSGKFDPRVTDESKDLYGKSYWFDHQTSDLGCPDILSRSRTDLSERCIHWMRSLLQFILPPAKVLEIGCAHGGFVAMLRQAGFDATGLELSPSIVQLATETFDVPVITGPIEDQSIPPQSLDAIVMMDVLEHLPNPLETVACCLKRLKPDGIFLAQTPAYPEGMTLKRLHEQKHQFPRMLDTNEHPFLFSRSSACELFRRAGAKCMEFIPAIFDFYDMSFVASRVPLQRHDAGQQSAALARTVNGRFIQALLDLDERRLNLLGKYRELRTQSRAMAG
ncbi:MAG TPA: class I SAM-dependent methyltransferase [Tepidisphaeraceae bacterium]|jgi:2-polyprenyl-3-methyl-5-hydroxy-6-metoxy-1,4-benzoquinol methylase